MANPCGLVLIVYKVFNKNARYTGKVIAENQ